MDEKISIYGIGQNIKQRTKEGKHIPIQVAFREYYAKGCDIFSYCGIDRLF